MVNCPECGTEVPKGEDTCLFCFRPLPEVERRENAVLQRPKFSAPELARPAGSSSIRFPGFWKRFFAFITDLAIFFLLAGCVWFALGQESSRDPGTTIVIAIVLFFLVYSPLFLRSRYRATPGKILLGIVVTETNGRTLSYTRAAIRELGKYVSCIVAGLGFAMIGFTAKKQGLHDLLARTLVVERSSSGIMLQAVTRPPDDAKVRVLGFVVIILCITTTIVPVVYGLTISHREVTAGSIAASGMTLAGDGIAGTKYPALSLPAYDAAITLQPNDTDIRVKELAVMENLGRTAEAQRDLDQMIALYPNETTPVIFQGDIYVRENRFADAETCYEKAIDADPKNAKLWVKKGDAYLLQAVSEMGNMRGMYRDLTSPSAMSGNGKVPLDAFRGTQSYQEAIAAYNHAIELDPMLSVVISGRVLTSTENLVDTYQNILNDLGGNKTGQ